jgi:multidrug efflux pump subunit AcrB
MSLAVARMITPMVAAYFLQGARRGRPCRRPWMDRYMAVLHWSLDTDEGRGLSREHRRATRTTGHRRAALAARLRDHRIWMIGVGAWSPAADRFDRHFAADGILPHAEQRLQRHPDRDGARHHAQADRSRYRTEVREHPGEGPETKNVLQRIFEGKALMVMLKEDRTKTSKEFENELDAAPPADSRRARVLPEHAGNGRRWSGTGRPISVMLTGTDSALLHDQTAAKLVEEMKG